MSSEQKLIRSKVLQFDNLILRLENEPDADVKPELEDVLFGRIGDGPLCTSDPFLRAIGASIFYHVSTDNKARVPDYLLKFITLVGNSLATKLGHKMQPDGSAGHLDFHRVTGVDRAYWIGRQNRLEHRPERPLPVQYHWPVFRINAVPFAEGVYGELMALRSRSDDDAYNILTVPVPWNKVGAALKNGFIDAAIYNDTIYDQLRSEISRKEIRIWETGRLFCYRKYPVLHNTSVADGMQGTIGIPRGTDFRKIFEELEQGKATCKADGEGEAMKIDELIVVFWESSDEALQKLVDGETEYALVGSVHAKYAKKRFEPNVTTHSWVESERDMPVKMFTIRSSRDEASDVLLPLVVAWKEAARAIKQMQKHERDHPPAGLLEGLNLRPKSIFVDDARTLMDLIKNHNDMDPDTVDETIYLSK
jgi:hypothetical protein